MRYSRAASDGAVLALMAATGTALTLLAAAGPARADERAQALLAQARAAMARARSLQADFETTFEGAQPVSGSLLLKRPNLARVEGHGPSGQLVVSDGATVYTYSPRQNQYRKGEPGRKGEQILVGDVVAVVGSFFQPDRIGVAAGAEPAYAGKETVGGVECDVVQLALDAHTIRRYAISPADHLIRRAAQKMEIAQGGATVRYEITTTLKNLRVDAPIDVARFRWTPPTTAKLYQPPTLADLEKQLIPAGKTAPDFNLPAPGGGRIALSDALKGRKAVLVNFWFYG